MLHRKDQQFMGHDERDLIIAWQNGDEEATCFLFDRYFPQAVRLGVLSGLALEEAQDCAQEAFARAFIARKQLRESQAFPLWFHRIVTSRIMNALRAPHSPLSLSAEQVSSISEDWQRRQLPQPEQMVIQREEQHHLWEYIQRLSPRHRLIIVLRYYADFSLHDIAAVLEMREGTVRVAL